MAGRLAARRQAKLTKPPHWCDDAGDEITLIESRSFCRRCRGRFTIRTWTRGTSSACFLPNTSPDVAPGKQPGATFLCDRRLSTRRLLMTSPQWRTEAMLSAIPNGTDVWMAVPASPPQRIQSAPVSMIAVRNVACRSITASSSQGRCCVYARVVSDPRTDLLFGEEIGEPDWKSDEAVPWLRCKGPTQSSDSAGETQPTATKAVRRPKKAIATLWRPPMEANRAG